MSRSGLESDTSCLVVTVSALITWQKSGLMVNNKESKYILFFAAKYLDFNFWCQGLDIKRNTDNYQN